MKLPLLFFLISFFSIFIGSQITEGAVLVPYWQSLSAKDFYSYYNQHGPSLGKFYTILTICAAIIPIATAIYCKSVNSIGFKSAVISSVLAIIFILSFYVYFKGTNALFYQAALSEVDLKRELVHWSYWHWGRIIIELLSLFFLARSFIQLEHTNI